MKEEDSNKMKRSHLIFSKQAMQALSSLVTNAITVQSSSVSCMSGTVLVRKKISGEEGGKRGHVHVYSQKAQKERKGKVSEMERGRVKEVGQGEEGGGSSERRELEGQREEGEERRQKKKEDGEVGRGEMWAKGECGAQYLLKLFFMNMRERLTKFPRLFSSSEFTLVTKSFQLEAVS